MKFTLKLLLVSLSLVLALAIPTVTVNAQSTDLPNWWTITNPTALNLGYPMVMSCASSNSQHIRVRFWLPLGPNQPNLSDILDPVWGDVRLHTAWDTGWTTLYGGNHVDINTGNFHFQGGGWQIIWTLDIPVDASNVANFTHYSPRLVNAWVDFQPFDGVDKVVVLSSQCRPGAAVAPGVQRDDLPPNPPVFPVTACH